MAEKRNYYLVAALAAGGGKTAVFTYHSEETLDVGKIVKISLGRRSSFGVIVANTTKPKFPTKPINNVSALPVLPKHLIELQAWMSDYYATPAAKVWQTMLPSVPYTTRATEPADLSDKIKPSPIKLVPQQVAALKDIQKGADHNYLLHGITGSGKTQVYIELATQALNEGKSTIVLVPEISLTPQITQTFKAVFGKRVIVTHSRMTPAGRRGLWRAALEATEPVIVIGPRSALFLPVKSLGFIIIDEAHDGSYKQDQSPRYHAPAVAAKLAHLTSAKLILGTATPSVSDLFLAQNHRLKLVNMPDRIYKSERSKPVIVDLRQKENLGSSWLLSTTLLDALKDTLKRGKQSILFLNRRGSARLLMCKKCGWNATCPNCQIPLTWHADDAHLRCHWCGYEDTPPAACPNCGNLELSFMGSGTKRLEAELAKYLPGARVARLDRDSLDTKNLNQFYDDLKTGKVDVLVGTQMITKGLDLPGVETVGVVLADNMLYMPDFSAGERTFQLLYQVSGRGGRREGSFSNTIIQTYSPDHPAIVAAALSDFEAFMSTEIEERKLLNYPPFVFLLKLSLTKATRPAAQTAAEELAAKLQKLPKVMVIGPAPSWQETLRGKFHWQIVIKAKDRDHLVKIARDLPTGWVHDLDPLDLL